MTWHFQDKLIEIFIERILHKNLKLKFCWQNICEIILTESNFAKRGTFICIIFTILGIILEYWPVEYYKIIYIIRMVKIGRFLLCKQNSAILVSLHLVITISSFWYLYFIFYVKPLMKWKCSTKVMFRFMWSVVLIVIVWLQL